MAARRDGEAFRWHEALRREGPIAAMSDGALLGRFLGPTGEEGEAAFEAMVRQHGAKAVLAACRRVLRDEHEADDAFQATFLVLARRAAGIRDPDRLAPWLARTARRIAVRARPRALRRERRSGDIDKKPAPEAIDLATVEAARCVGAEVDRLPEPDRLLMRLTYWQGKTYEEAAELLSWPVGTVRSRLTRARERLRGRLARLGLAPAVAAMPPESLVLRTVRAAGRAPGGYAASVEAGAVPASVAAMVEGELAMIGTVPWKAVAAVLLVGGAVAAGASSMARKAPEAAAGPQIAPGPVPGKAEGKPLLVNGGVEEGEGDSPKAWARGAAVPGVTYTWSRDVGHGGGASLGLKKTANRYFPIAGWSQTVDRAGDAPRLKVSAWIKAEAAGKAILDAQFFDGNGEWSHAWVAYIGAKKGGDPPVTHDWKRYEGVVTIPAGTKRIVIAPQIYGPGSVWFDDLAAEPTVDPRPIRPLVDLIGRLPVGVPEGQRGPSHRTTALAMSETGPDVGSRPARAAAEEADGPQAAEGEQGDRARLWDGVDLAEEAVGLVVDAGEEEEGVRVEPRADGAESEAPEARDDDHVAVGVAELAEEGAARRVERVDVAAVLVADQEVAAELTEGGRRQHDAPGSVERGSRRCRAGG